MPTMNENRHENCRQNKSYDARGKCNLSINDPDRQELVVRYPVNATWIGDLPDGFDSHFHLDRSRWSLGAPEASVEDLCPALERGPENCPE